MGKVNAQRKEWHTGSRVSNVGKWCMLQSSSHLTPCHAPAFHGVLAKRSQVNPCGGVALSLAKGEGSEGQSKMSAGMEASLMEQFGDLMSLDLEVSITASELDF